MPAVADDLHPMRRIARGFGSRPVVAGRGEALRNALLDALEVIWAQLPGPRPHETRLLTGGGQPFGAAADRGDEEHRAGMLAPATHHWLTLEGRKDDAQRLGRLLRRRGPRTATPEHDAVELAFVALIAVDILTADAFSDLVGRFEQLSGASVARLYGRLRAT